MNMNSQFHVKKFNSITVAAFTKIVTAFLLFHYVIANSEQHALNCYPLRLVPDEGF
jgi:hypothetical protein